MPSSLNEATIFKSFSLKNSLNSQRSFFHTVSVPCLALPSGEQDVPPVQHQCHTAANQMGCMCKLQL